MTDEGAVLIEKMRVEFFCQTPFSSGEGENIYPEVRMPTTTSGKELRLLHSEES